MSDPVKGAAAESGSPQGQVHRMVPVLPLREVVVFPALLPAALGRPQGHDPDAARRDARGGRGGSIRNRQGDAGGPHPEGRRGGPSRRGRSLSGGHRRPARETGADARRHRPDRDPRQLPVPRRADRADGALRPRGHPGAGRNRRRQQDRRVRSADPQDPRRTPGDDQDGLLPSRAGGHEDPVGPRGERRSTGGLRRRTAPEPQHRDASGDPPDAVHRGSAGARLRGDPAREAGARTRAQHRVQGQERGRPHPARVLPARADEGDPEGTRRGRRLHEGDGRAPGEDREGRNARGGREGSPAGVPAARPDPSRLGGIHRGTDVPRLAGPGSLGQADRGQVRHSARQGHPRSRPLRPREGQGPHPRVPGGPGAETRPEGTHPLLRGTARRRQDEPRQVHRQGRRPRVRPAQPRRHPRRSRDPGASPDLHRRAARPDRPGPRTGRHPESRVHAG